MEFFSLLVFAIIALVALFALANIAAAVFYRMKPQLFRSPHEIMIIGYTERFKPLRKYLDDWFDLSEGDWDAFAADWDQYRISTFAYDPLCEYKHSEWKSRFINMSPHGFRAGKNQGEWPPSPQNLNIFFFGASALHQLGPDWATVSSYLQEALDKETSPRPVRIYNFGRAAYFSSLEKTLLFKLLADGHVPDLALFFDGSTDIVFHHGLPATHAVMTRAIQSMGQELVSEYNKSARATPKWNLLRDFVASLPLLHILTILQRRKVEVKPLVSATPFTETQIDDIINRWLSNRRQIEAVCASYGCGAAFIWHPTPSYKYDLSHHVALSHFGGLHGHERAGAVYESLRTRLGHQYDSGNMIWLADMQENRKEALYIDTVHFTAPFNRIMADKIAVELTQRKMIPD